MSLIFSKWFNTHISYSDYNDNVLNASDGENYKDNISYCLDDDHIHYNGKLACKMTSLEPNDDTVINISIYQVKNRKLTWNDMVKSGISTYIGYDPYEYKLAKIEVYDTVTELDPTSGFFDPPATFMLLTGLKELIIPDSISVIPHSLCWACEALETVKLGSGITEIQNSAFDQAFELTTFICMAETPPTLGGIVFPSDSTFNIYVPDNSVSAYKSATGWSNYASNIFSLSSYQG